jgi:pentatricopeptide repeat protein
MGASIEGAMIHDLAMRNLSGELSDVVLGSALIDMYCRCGLLKEARVVFDKLWDRNIVSWGAMVSGYVEHGLGHAALDLFDDLECEGLSPNRALFLSCTKACASVGDIAKGRHLHSHISRLGLDSDATIGSSILDMYAKCGSMVEAIRCFEKIGARDVICWNAMITGCIQHSLHKGAMELFQRMQADNVEPDEVSMLSILQACGQLGALSHGHVVHSMAIESSLASEMMVPAVGRSVVDMYARCGSLEDAQKALCALTKQDVISFSSLIAGYAEAGDCEMIGKCLGMMRERGLEPDRKTFSSLLSACVHAGEIAEGYTYFGAMRSDYGILPGIEHFNSMIGLLAHVGCLEAASEMMGTMPISPDTTGRMSLIVACQNFGSFELGNKCYMSVQHNTEQVSDFALEDQHCKLQREHQMIDREGS